ncbi:PIG-L family deacetylase [Acidobacterium sp. S8]|uniref:PIG-L family deacetylase n=1 Tax=Acidobacterium sp. S8 TaxID=1641854 RepID=UPI00131B99D6|nr:PIG-L family deacetylase [Acidobacterium sp. S8]
MQPASRRLKLIATLALATATMTQAQTVPWATQIAATPNAHTLPEDRGADGLWQTLRKLHTWASVMMIVAHPDDEDGGMLTLESRGAGARVAMLTLTRGEGGQNAMSSETYDALGLIRTNELLRADEFSGTEQYWSRVADYGFSKTIDEAFEQWGHDRVLYDVVRAVRLNRPLVLTSVFTGNITDGHGHHQVSGEMAQEAFKAAGDPNVFPDQIAEGLRPWSPLKVYARVPGFSIGGDGAHKTMFDYATGKSSPLHLRDYVNQTWMDDVPATNVVIPEGSFDPVLGRSYVQMSREGWSEQKSQNGGGNPPLPGPFDVDYHRYGSRVGTKDQESSFFDGIDVSLAGIASLAHGDNQFLKDGLREIDRHVTKALYAYIPSDPSKIVPDLHDGYQKTQQLIDAVNASGLSADDKSNVSRELQIKLAQFNTALAEALGLQVNALVAPGQRTERNPFSGSAAAMTFLHATPGMDFNVRLHVTSAEPWTTGGKLRLTRTWLVTPESEHWPVERQGGVNTSSGVETDIPFKVEVPSRATPTRPYFSRPSIEQPYYNIDDKRWLNRPFAPYPVEGWAEFNYDGVPIRIGQVVQTVHWVHGPGAVYQPLVVLPRISVKIGTGAGVMPLGEKSFPLAVTLDNEQQSTADGELHLELPAGWTAEPATAKFHLPANDPLTIPFTVHPSFLTDASYTIKAVARSGNYEFTEGVQQVGYPGVRPYYYYHPATYLARGVDVKVAPNLKVGYIMGTGDEVPQALEQIGIQSHLLTDDEILHGDLSQYDAIVLGIRTYAARPVLMQANQRLLDFAQNGGTVVVQYNSPEYDHNFGPYPYSLGRLEKVVDEKSKVTILEPNNPLLNWPNKITEGDFNGWIEERGHSFMESWDSHYAALTETHDPGQDPQKGGLLYARYGKGAYIYVAYALYRQTDEAVPGAYRIFANLVSAGHAGASR